MGRENFIILVWKWLGQTVLTVEWGFSWMLARVQLREAAPTTSKKIFLELPSRFSDPLIIILNIIRHTSRQFVPLNHMSRRRKKFALQLFLRSNVIRCTKHPDFIPHTDFPLNSRSSQSDEEIVGEYTGRYGSSIFNDRRYQHQTRLQVERL